MPGIVRKYPSFYVVDVNYKTQHIGHWCVLIFVNKGSPSEFFDSFAKSPSEYDRNLTNVLKNNGNGSYIYNKSIVQHPDSTSCGAFCCFIADKRNQGLSLEGAVNILSTSNLQSNDNTVNKYLYTHMLMDS